MERIFILILPIRLLKNLSNPTSNIFIIYIIQACGKYIPATANVQNSQTGQAMDGTYLVEASF